MPDPERVADYFTKAFGVEKVSVDKLPDGRVKAEFRIIGDRMITNTPQPGDDRGPDSLRRRYGTEHLGMKEDDLEGALRQCLAAGTEPVMGVTQIRPGTRIAFFMAPNDVLVELLETK